MIYLNFRGTYGNDGVLTRLPTSGAHLEKNIFFKKKKYVGNIDISYLSVLVRVLERLDQPEGLVNAATNGEVVHGDLGFKGYNY